MTLRLPPALLLGSAFACTPDGEAARDAVPPSRDVVVSRGAPARAEAYDYIARRPLAAVALAEARGIAPAVIQAAIDHLADSLASCVAEHGHGGAPPEGAARIVAQVDPSGGVAAATLRVDPGHGAAEIAVLCLAAPVKGLAFAPVDAGARGFAIEALWGHVPDSR